MTDFDLGAIRARLASLEGKAYWRSLEEVADTEEFQRYLHREFPVLASELTDPVGRRQFLKLMGASLALAGVTACTRQPPEEIIPYVRPVEDMVPGRPFYFATGMPLSGIVTGLLVESHMGRPTKVEGNPDHPASLGATDAFAQASILTLYDPDRSQTLTERGEVRPWGAFLGAMQAAVAARRPLRGAGLRILTETVTSPTLADQIRRLLADLPAARWHQYEPVNRDGAYAGARLAFGQPLDAHYRIASADVIVSLDSDFLVSGPAAPRYAREFAARRRPESGGRASRLYAIESTLSRTGSVADHRLPLRPSAIDAFARALASGLGVAAPAPSAPAEARSEVETRWIDALVRDLQGHRGSSLVLAGEQQPPIVHALAYAMNQALRNVGATIVFTDPVAAEPVDQMQSLRELTAAMQSGQVDMLLIAGGNPVYTAPADLRFADAMAQVGLRVHLGVYSDETAELCHWHVPEAHFLEAWGDARTFDGTVTIMQPLIAPLYNGKSVYELLGALSGQPDRSGYEVIREYWTTHLHTGAVSGARGAGVPAPPGMMQAPPAGAATGSMSPFERRWRKALHDGVIAGSAFPLRLPGSLAAPVWAGNTSVPGPVATTGASTQALAEPGQSAHAARPGEIEIIFRPDPSIYDGRFANNGWLQELPKPLTKLTWDNAAMVSPAMAERLGLRNEQLVEIRREGRSVTAPIWILPGHADAAVTVHLGYGRTRAGRVGNGAGFNAYAIRTSDAPWLATGAHIVPASGVHRLASTQMHFNMENRHLVRAGTFDEYRDNPHFVKEMGEAPPRTLTLYPDHEYKGYAWGMAIDLSSCNGCNACVVACVAENNIPVVGREQVLAQRAMHWLRIDTYFSGPLENPETYYQPMLCQHCENAPCEVVCPVGATTHSAEGLNEMTYNRCVGTRYCSHNCPYKVRRFNFLLYSDFTTPSLKMARNPDVTVRSRGVMEKCTFCVQRINAARIDAEREDRGVRDGEIVTACQGACPAQAIVFGNINDPNSRVARLKAQERNYGVLADLNTRPRTTYLASLRNPNPELDTRSRGPSGPHEEDGHP